MLLWLTIVYWMALTSATEWCPSCCRCPSVERADCSNASLQGLPHGEFNIMASYVDFSYNEFTSVNFQMISGLEVAALFQVNFSHNRIEDIDVHSFRGEPWLTHVDLSWNKLYQVHSRTFDLHTKQMKWLSLAGNPRLFLMDMGSFMWGVSIEFLNISYCNFNRIPDYTFKYLDKLQVLDLSHNNITSLTNKTFFGISNLQNLDLSYNKINCIQMDIYYYLSKVTIIDVNHTPLQIFIDSLNLTQVQVREQKHRTRRYISYKTTERNSNSSLFDCNCAQKSLTHLKSIIPLNVTIETQEILTNLSDVIVQRLRENNCQPPSSLQMETNTNYIKDDAIIMNNISSKQSQSMPSTHIQHKYSPTETTPTLSPEAMTINVTQLSILLAVYFVNFAAIIYMIYECVLLTKRRYKYMSSDDSYVPFRTVFWRVWCTVRTRKARDIRKGCSDGNEENSTPSPDPSQTSIELLPLR